MFIFALYRSLENFVSFLLPLLELIVAQSVEHNYLEPLVVMGNRFMHTVEVDVGLECTPVLPLEEESRDLFLHLNLSPSSKSVR